jgi:hypothetical protein
LAGLNGDFEILDTREFSGKTHLAHAHVCTGWASTAGEVGSIKAFDRDLAAAFSS